MAVVAVIPKMRPLCKYWLCAHLPYGNDRSRLNPNCPFTNLSRNFSIITGGSAWLCKAICRYRNVVYTRVNTVEANETEENQNTFEISENEPQPQKTVYTLMTSLALFSIILGYFYLCDRYFRNYLISRN